MFDREKDQTTETAGGGTTATAPIDPEAQKLAAAEQQPENNRELTSAEKAALEDGAPKSEVEDGSVRARAEAMVRGWPAETTDGERVMIVSKTGAVGGDILTSEDGRRFVSTGGDLVQELDDDGRLPREAEAVATEPEEGKAA